MMTTSMSNGGNGQMMNEEYKAHSEENELNDEEMTDEGITDEEDLSDDEDITDEDITEEGLSDEDEMIDEDEMTDEEMTFIMELQIAVVSFLFGMAFMGILVYVTTPAFKFFI